MYRFSLITMIGLAVTTTTSFAIEIEQENDFFIEDVDWAYNPVNGTITISTAHPTQTYVFWAHEDGDPNTLAEIQEIQRSSLLTQGTIRLMVSRTPGTLTPGATTIGAVTIDEPGNDQITSYIEGIETTGDFLTTQAMTVNGVTGDGIQVGGSVSQPITVEQDATLIQVLDTLLADLHVQGSADDIFAGALFANSITVDQDVRSSLWIAGPLALSSAVVVGGNLDGSLWIAGTAQGVIRIGGVVTQTGSVQIDGDLSGYLMVNTTGVPGPSLFGTLEVNGDVMNLTKWVDTSIWVDGGMASGADIHVTGNTVQTYDASWVIAVYGGGVESGASIRIDGTHGGDIHVSKPGGDGLAGTIDIGVDMTGMIYVLGGAPGAIEIGRDFLGVINAPASLGILDVGRDVLAPLDLRGAVAISIGRDLLATITVRSLGTIDVGGDLLGTIDVGNPFSVVSTPSVIIEGELGAGAQIRCRSASVFDGGPDDEALFTFQVNGTDFVAAAAEPVEFCGYQDSCYENIPDSLWVGGGAADAGFMFDITIERGVCGTEPKASIVVDNESQVPAGARYDLRLYSPGGADFDLAGLSEKTVGTGFAHLHDLIVEGDVLFTDDGAPAIDLPDAEVNSIFVTGNLDDTITADSIGLLAFDTLGADLTVPCDATGSCGYFTWSGSTPVITAQQYVRANEPIQTPIATYHFYRNDTSSN